LKTQPQMGRFSNLVIAENMRGIRKTRILRTNILSLLQKKEIRARKKTYKESQFESKHKTKSRRILTKASNSNLL